jgi:glutamate---cysteine ligase / carboxylate-amine ligase
MTRTVGIEEELLLIDPETRAIGSRSPQVLKEFREHRADHDTGVADNQLDREFYRHQVEIRSRPATDLDEIRAQVISARRYAAESAEAAGLAIAASGIVPRGGGPLEVSDDDRYRTMLTTYRRIGAYGAVCGLHVHVAVDSDEEGVAVIDRIAPWLPVLIAIAANSPFHDGEDTGYASWRSETWRRWPSAGVTEQFGSLAGYRAACRFLIESGAAGDERMLYLAARLSPRNPTVEVRVADACTDLEDALLVAALTRGLVETAARDAAAGRGPDRWRSEALRACHWKAARYGVSEALVHPVRREQAPAREVLDALAEHVGDVLEDAGDADLVAEGIGRVTTHSGASLQRAAYERTGSVEGVVDDLIERTRAAWEA